VQGFDAVKLDTEAGEFDTYLHGQWSRDGWWYYNLVAVGLKTPIPILALSLAGLFLWRRGVKDRRETWVVVLPALLLFVFPLAAEQGGHGRALRAAALSLPPPGGGGHPGLAARARQGAPALAGSAEHDPGPPRPGDRAPRSS
jgi:hypothetical protein